ILIIDNYDSFTYNLVQYLGELAASRQGRASPKRAGGELRPNGRGEDLQVFRNDKITIKEIERLKPDKIVISPGPGRPKEAGISKEVIKHFASKVPILGVCLGHQCIAEVFGAKIVRAKRLMHGKTSEIYHQGKGIYRGLPKPFIATRYHSLIVDSQSLPGCLTVTARTKEKEIMGIRHKKYKVEGVQFHPESVLTGIGKKLLKNFLNA
ncbi:aminodeoxychorismate/anthranilate synthase component II, partial [bacterium]|nr:aminodeoxychorismate/anthranilate synthase component II [bacterium]